MGAVTPLGNSPGAFWSALMAGRSGVARLPAALAARLSVAIAASVSLDVSSQDASRRLADLDRFSQFGLIAASQAIDDAQMAVDERSGVRIGVALGTAMGGAATLDKGYQDLYKNGLARIRPSTALMAMNSAAASQISIAHGLRGPSLTYSAACASSAIAIGEAYRLIKHGYADAMLAGGSEALLTYGTLKAWESLRALAVEDPEDPSASCRPFSKDRCGLVLGEGAAVMVLEDAGIAARRGARIYAELVGYGCCSDAHDMVKPSVEGTSRAMSLALEEAGIQPAEVDYINAHGTATLIGDQIETAAIKQAFGDAACRIPVSSTKSMHGHAMGAAGALEFLAAVLAIVHRAVPPTANLRIPDPCCDLDYVANKARTGVPVKAAMSNSFAFGGANAVLLARAVQ